jgi:hypothetical protein
MIQVQPVASIASIRRAVPFDARFLERHALLWPLARAAQPFRDSHGWPAVAAWSAVFAAGAAPPMGFTVAAPRPRGHRRRDERVPAYYDASIVERGLVPSRERHWHDFLNALVWGTFPRAKSALHRRQAALIAARADGVAQLPSRRTREQDGLAMIDEGGVIALEAPASQLCLVFGHALYEGFVLGVPHMTARLVRLAVPTLAADPLGQADAALAERLADATFSTLPDALPRVFVPDAPSAPWLAPSARPGPDGPKAGERSGSPRNRPARPRR